MQRPSWRHQCTEPARGRYFRCKGSRPVPSGACGSDADGSRAAGKRRSGFVRKTRPFADIPLESERVRPPSPRSTQRASISAIVVLVVAARASAGAGKPSPPTNPWADTTTSPRAGAVSSTTDAAIADACGGGIDGSLATVAAEVVQALATNGTLPDAQEVEWRQRKAGSPHPWPRTWGAHVGGTSLDRKALALDVKKWLGKSAPRVRCGVASFSTVASAG